MLDLIQNAIDFSDPTVWLVLAIIWYVFCTQKTFRVLFYIKWALVALSFVGVVVRSHFTGDTIKMALTFWLVLWWPFYIKIVLIIGFIIFNIQFGSMGPFKGAVSK